MQPTEFRPVAGQELILEDNLSLVLAPNPSPMTNLGTNTYILGREQLCIIDPGPDNDAHLAALLAVIGKRQVSHIIATHNHLDHSPLCKRLSEATGAKVYAFGDHLAGRSQVMQDLAPSGLAGGGEGIDLNFKPDMILSDGAKIQTAEWDLTVLHTPGHIGNHICIVWGDAMFTGDHIMGWASSLVSPPDGDLTDFMASCEKLKALPARIYYAGHGAPIEAPKARLDWLIGHRKAREAQIIAALSGGNTTPLSITNAVYQDVPKALLGAAERNVFAHLIDLVQRGKVDATPRVSRTADYRLVQEI